MPRRFGTYNTLEDEFQGNHLGEASARRERKKRKRKVGVCVTVTVLLCLVLIFVFAILLLLTIEKAKHSESGHSESQNASCSKVDRFNCIPEGQSSQSLCEKRGCCWDKSSTQLSCYYPSGFGYSIDGQVNKTSFGFKGNLKIKAGQPSQYGGDVESLRVDVYFETESRLRVKVRNEYEMLHRLDSVLAVTPIGAHRVSPSHFHAY